VIGGMGKKGIFIFLVIIILVTFPSIVGQKALLAKENYKVAVLPEYLPIEIWQRLHPLMTYLEDSLGVRFELLIPRSIEQHIEMVKKEEVDFSYQNPFVFLEIWEYSSPLTITEKGKGETEARGIIITRNDSRIKTIEDLKGKTVSVVSPYSAGGFVAQKVLLRKRGIDVSSELLIIEAQGNKQENVIFDVLLKRADAGFIEEEAVGRIESKGLLSPGKIQEIKIIAYAEGTPNWIFSGNKNLPLKERRNVQKTLLNIPLDHSVLRSAKIRRFAPVTIDYLVGYRSKVQGK
jgi:phosphonate transport system substrate-binding protein